MPTPTISTVGSAVSVFLPAQTLRIGSVGSLHASLHDLAEDATMLTAISAADIGADVFVSEGMRQFPISRFFLDGATALAVIAQQMKGAAKAAVKTGATAHEQGVPTTIKKSIKIAVSRVFCNDVVTTINTAVPPEHPFSERSAAMMAGIFTGSPACPQAGFPSTPVCNGGNLPASSEVERIVPQRMVAAYTMIGGTYRYLEPTMAGESIIARSSVLGSAGRQSNPAYITRLLRLLVLPISHPKPSTWLMMAGNAHDSLMAGVAQDRTQSGQTVEAKQSSGYPVAQAELFHSLRDPAVTIPQIANMDSNTNSHVENEAAATVRVGKKDKDIEFHLASRDRSHVFAGWRNGDNAANSVPKGMALAAEIEPPKPTLMPLVSNAIAALGLEPQASGQAWRTYDERDAILEAKFTALILSQLKDGPASLKGFSLLKDFNQFMKENYWNGIKPVVSEAEWKQFLREALRLALRHTPVFDEAGARPVEKIFKDASKLLGIKHNLFAAWEKALNVDAFAKQLSGNTDAHTEFNQQLLDALDGKIGMRAGGILEIPNREFAFGTTAETELEWTAARMSIIRDSAEKTELAGSSLISLFKDGRLKRAGRLLAIIFNNSIFNEFYTKSSSWIPIWTEGDLRLLFNRLVQNGAWAVLSHRSFRQYLTRRENRAANILVEEANLGHTHKGIADIDVENASDEEFWAAVDASHMGEQILDHAVERMAEMIRLAH